MKTNNSNITNLLFISSSNIIQQFLSILVTIFLIKFYGVENYGSYIALVSIINLISLFINPILNPYFLREGSLEFIQKKYLKKTFSISILSISILIFIFIFFFNFINNKFNFINNKFNVILILFLISLILISLLKIISRITNRIKIYSLVTLLEKFILAIVMLIYFFLNHFDFLVILKTYSIILLSISILLLFLFRDQILFTIKLKDIFLVFYKSLSYLYISAFVFFFINQHYLILLIKSNTNNNILIATIGFAFLIVNMIYFPVYWLEQNYSQKYYKKITSFNKNNFDVYFNKFGYLITSTVIIISSIVLLIIYYSNILKIFDVNFYYGKELICLIILLSLSVCLDTILATPVFAIKEEKIILISLICRFILFYLFFYFNKNPLSLIYAYVLLCYFQNFIILFIIYLKFNYLEKNLIYLIFVYSTLILLFYLKYIYLFNLIITIAVFFSFRFLIKNYSLIKSFLLDNSRI